MSDGVELNDIIEGLLAVDCGWPIVGPREYVDETTGETMVRLPLPTPYGEEPRDQIMIKKAYDESVERRRAEQARWDAVSAEIAAKERLEEEEKCKAAYDEYHELMRRRHTGDTLTDEEVERVRELWKGKEMHMYGREYYDDEDSYYD